MPVIKCLNHCIDASWFFVIGEKVSKRIHEKEKVNCIFLPKNVATMAEVVNKSFT